MPDLTLKEVVQNQIDMHRNYIHKLLRDIQEDNIQLDETEYNELIRKDSNRRTKVILRMLSCEYPTKK